MTNAYFNPSGYPSTRQTGPTSAPLRAEFVAIQTAFDLLPVPTGNAGRLTKINAGATGMVVTTSLYEVANNFGVGAASPAYKIDVNAGSADVAGRLLTTGTSAVMLFSSTGTTGDGPYVGGIGNTVSFGRYGVAEYASIDANGNFIGTLNASAPSLAANGRFVISAASNTSLRFSYRGTDGTTRSGTLAIA